MNERIKELIPRPWTFPYPDREMYSREQMEHLAELIVRECVFKIESKRSSGENTDQWTITRDMCYHDMMRELKEHFGVEYPIT